MSKQERTLPLGKEQADGLFWREFSAFSLMHVLETYNQDCFVIFIFILLYFSVALDWNILHCATNHTVKNL